MALTRLGLNQSINLASNTTGTLGVANGGTGLTSGTTDQFLKFTGSTTVASSLQLMVIKLQNTIIGELQQTFKEMQFLYLQIGQELQVHLKKLAQD
jgi:hypothetical protein